MDKKSQLICLWCGPVMVVTFLIGFVALGGFLPPPRPDLSAVEVARFYQANTGLIRLGLFLCIISTTLIGPWGIAIAVRANTVEGTRPVLFYTQIAMVIVSTVASILGPVFWSLASFRPLETSPEIVQAFNDTGWIMFLVTWPPFSVWFIALAMCIFRDKRPVPEFPRWLGFFCLWAAVFLVPAGWVIFFKSGPFSWAGLFGLYIPVVVFLGLILSLTVPALKAVSRETS